MQAPSSPSFPPRNPTNPQMRAPAPPPTEKYLRTRQGEMFCKRRGTLFNKVSELCGRTGARAAVIVLSSKGMLSFSGGSSVEEMEEISFDYVRYNGGAMPPMGPKEGLEWVKKERHRPETGKIADQVQLPRTFSNRLKTLTTKAYKLCTDTDARAAVVVFFHTGFHCQFGNSSFENIIFDWVKKQRESCVTEEDLVSLIMKYEAVLRYVREKLKDISGSGNSGVGAGCDSEGLSDDDIDSVLQSFEGSHPLLFARFKDYFRDGFLTTPVNSAVASGSSGKEPTRSVLVGCEFNPHSSLNLSENNPSVNAGDEVLADFGNCNRNGDSDSFLTSPVNLAVAGGSSGVESIPACSDLEGCGFDPDDFLNLSEEFVHDVFLTLPENLTVDGGSS